MPRRKIQYVECPRCADHLLRDIEKGAWGSFGFCELCRVTTGGQVSAALAAAYILRFDGDHPSTEELQRFKREYAGKPAA